MDNENRVNCVGEYAEVFSNTSGTVSLQLCNCYSEVKELVSFSPEAARALAEVLLREADIAEGIFDQELDTNA